MTAEEIKILIRQMVEDYTYRAQYAATPEGRQLLTDYSDVLSNLLHRIEDADVRQSS